MASLETFPNQFPGRDYEIEITCPEFTAVCPKTGQPDFGTIVITYVPDATCIELKSLKLYLHDYRNRGIFYEHSINTILDDLVAACQPRRMRVIGQFTPRGGISSRITAVYQAPVFPPPAGPARRCGSSEPDVRADGVEWARRGRDATTGDLDPDDRLRRRRALRRGDEGGRARPGARDARFVDVSHAIAPQNILEGAFVLAEVVDAFPAGTVHLAVVDPGVGTDRRLIAATVAGQWFVLPDNGLITGVTREPAPRPGSGRSPTPRSAARPSRPRSTAATSSPRPPRTCSAAATPPTSARRARSSSRSRNFEPGRGRPTGYVGEVIFRDAFGNLITNVAADRLAGAPPDGWSVEIAGERIDGLVRTYGDHPDGRPGRPDRRDRLAGGRRRQRRRRRSTSRPGRARRSGSAGRPTRRPRDDRTP